MIKVDLKRHRREVIGAVIVLLLLLGGVSVFKYTTFNPGFEIVDDLGGNIFPSAILSVASHYPVGFHQFGKSEILHCHSGKVAGGI